MFSALPVGSRSLSSTPLSLVRRYEAGRRSARAPGESNTQHSALPWSHGALAQLGERRLCKPEVTGSIPVRSIARRALFGLVVGPADNSWPPMVRLFL